MKTLKYAAFLVAASFALIFTACDKEDDEAPAEPVNRETRTDLLTRAEWKGDDLLEDGVSLKNDTSAGIDITRLKIKFNKSGSYTITDLDGDTATDSWNFINNETQIVISGDTNTITVLTKDNFNITSPEARPANVPPAIEIRFVH